jgi:hypothetical protein
MNYGMIILCYFAPILLIFAYKKMMDSTFKYPEDIGPRILALELQNAREKQRMIDFLK